MEEAGQWKEYDQNVLNEIKFFKKITPKICPERTFNCKGNSKVIFLNYNALVYKEQFLNTNMCPAHPLMRQANPPKVSVYRKGTTK